VVALATGLILNLKANSLASDFNRTGDPSTQSSQSSYKTGAIVGYAAGAGTLVAGVVLYLVGRSSTDATPSQVLLLPVFSPAQFSLNMKRTF
jgi:hypothetical protein